LLIIAAHDAILVRRGDLQAVLQQLNSGRKRLLTRRRRGDSIFHFSQHGHHDLRIHLLHAKDFKPGCIRSNLGIRAGTTTAQAGNALKVPIIQEVTQLVGHCRGKFVSVKQVNQGSRHEDPSVGPAIGANDVAVQDVYSHTAFGTIEQRQGVFSLLLMFVREESSLCLHPTGFDTF
jgi:hypothetical protein